MYRKLDPIPRASSHDIAFPPAETVEFFRQYYGPTQRAFASLDPSAQDTLRRDLVELQTTHNVAEIPGSTEVAAEYLETVAARS